MNIPANAQARLDILFSEDGDRITPSYAPDGALYLFIEPDPAAALPLHFRTEAGQVVVTPMCEDADSKVLNLRAEGGRVALRVTVRGTAPELMLFRAGDGPSESFRAEPGFGVLTL